MRQAIWTTALVTFLAAAPAAMAQTPSGFYGRVSVGGAFSNPANFIDVDPNQTISALGPGGTMAGHVGSGVLFGGGLGYTFSPLFWADVTVTDMPDRQFRGTANVNPATTQFDFINNTAKIDSLAVMLNGYVDVARLLSLPVGKVKPYAMAGLGYARNHMGTLSGTALGGTGPISFAGATRNNFAWGIGFGVGVPVTQRIGVDFGYEYLDLGEARTGNGSSFSGGNFAGLPMRAALSTHTLQLSLRVGF